MRLAADWGKLHAGDELVVSHLDGPGLVVSPVNTKDELWIPASLIPNSAISRAWSFRPRKIDHARCHVADPREPVTATTAEDKTPIILSSPTSIRATVGEIVRLSVETHNADNATVTWRKEGESQCIRENDRYQFQRSAGFVYLQIIGCRASDSGIYHCHLKGETGSCSVGISLFVLGTLIKDPAIKSISRHRCTVKYRSYFRWEEQHVRARFRVLEGGDRLGQAGDRRRVV